MAETEYKRLIQSAKDKALFGFLAAVQRSMQDADKGIVDRLLAAKSGLDQTALTSVRHFLRQDGNIFLRRVDTLFRKYLDRAVQTMYVDLRSGMRKLSADELSLIDDEVVSHQIEVGRLTERMREANEEAIGRLNVMISQMHGQHEARERENPFRPYLLARALYEAVKESVSDDAKARLLFEHLSNAMVQHLPGYYSAIRDVFESAGMRGRFVAQQSRAAHNQRYFGAPPGALPDQISARIVPSLQRMSETIGSESKGADGKSTAGDKDQPPTVQDFIRKMFSPSRGQPGDSRMTGITGTASNPLVAQLNKYQKMAAQGQSVSDDLQPGQNQLAALRDKLDLGAASTMERMTVEVVAMLFEFILEDEQIPAELRALIGRLQIPILKAAILEPELMHDEGHPSRQLLNRMSSAAVGVDVSSAAGQQLAGEIGRLVRRILDEFDSSTAIFALSVREFEQFLANHLKRDDSLTERGIEAVEAAEKYSVLLTNTTNTLCDVLLPLNADKGISDFIIHVWPHVLVQASWRDLEKQVQLEQADSLFQQYRTVLPELLWSIQEKQNPQERSTLMRLLPPLVKRLREALAMVQLPEDESTQILDRLVALHTQVLRGAAGGAGKELSSLDDLRQVFSRLVVSWDRASWGLGEPPQPRTAIIEEIFGRFGLQAELRLDVKSAATSAPDREFLAQTYLLGTRVELRAADGGMQPGQLVWVSTHRSLYLFKRESDGSLILYTFASLLEALNNEEVIPVEYAPVFERAVESLLFGAGNMKDTVL
ncbi:MAG TPA: DUF1631 family protein [Noviherbaspirillum sp.]|uniref:DUF1631 family protein n=1 Tax=Noviherbaspirillum sp. TaxID=1926288 RepID=UPI002B48FEF7|nr:DUF1631 family protein [Noviherbaspirillum sp.]HJV85110.1 DUF1631 family protein [Noviherbaspirillum sp.]